MPSDITDRRFSLEEFERLPDDPGGERRELVRGRVVSEPPAGFEHGWIAATVSGILGQFVRKHRLGVVVGAETGFVLSDGEPPLIRAPDAAFVAAARLPLGTTRIKRYARLAPDLAVEVVSPSNTRAGVRAKVRDYLDAGARLVWVLDPDDMTATAHRPGGTVAVYGPGDALTGEDVLPGFHVAVEQLFPRLSGDVVD